MSNNYFLFLLPTLSSFSNGSSLETGGFSPMMISWFLGALAYWSSHWRELVRRFTSQQQSLPLKKSTNFNNSSEASASSRVGKPWSPPCIGKTPSSKSSLHAELQILQVVIDFAMPSCQLLLGQFQLEFHVLVFNASIFWK
jgi:hypothetical protein